MTKFKLFFLFCLFLTPISWANYSIDNQQVAQFIERMQKNHSFTQDELIKIFSQAEKKQSILDAIARPAEKTKAWKEYRPIFITNQRIKEGQDFYQKNLDILNQAEQTFGVSKEIIVAILGVETRFGQHKGGYKVIDALSTLSFDYPPRADFFSKQLEEYLLLCQEQNFDPQEMKGSYAGAIGMAQFIPSSYRDFAIDFDGDHKADLVNSTADAIGSIANYFKKHQWEPGDDVVFPVNLATVGKNINLEDLLYDGLKPKYKIQDLLLHGLNIPGVQPNEEAKLFEFEGTQGKEYWVGLHNFYVITRYNHSALYAMAVYQLSEEVRP